ncbi:chaperone [Buttiauxella noackiae ATCC 51607]|uniref:Chaperone n=1 Tax=Buttiauxella noackiae ATCC 51607 TaxID=1354255 RepID=A0A1B7HPH4_9ENTR|nr:molecular chaperone [Buttiauxella noackiae]OAT17542.1 chaperone [Buttiauxella noackiae ATCC 51607]
MSLGRSLLTFALVGTCLSSQASVVMTGNRVVYPADAKQVSVQLTNQDDFPNVMQAWLDSGDEQSTPQTARAPFMLTPPMFRMAAHSGQTLRLQFTGADLPKDKESVFWLNILQIPPVAKGSEASNQMIVMLRSRMKVFWRPAGLQGSPNEMNKTTTASVSGRKLSLTNNSGYYASIAHVVVTIANKPVKLGGEMIAPGATKAWPLVGTPMGDSVQMTWINDQGAYLSGALPLKH